MAVLTAIAFAALLLEYDNLVALYEGFGYFAYYFCSFNGRSANLYGTVGVYEQNAVELNGLTFLNLVAEIVNIQEAVLFSLELLALNFYNNVHYNI